MKEWDVFVNGFWKGIVRADKEQEARHAALSTYDIDTMDELEVSER